ncbi:MAG: outer membrane beta-barrel protein [Flavobacteriales bacterium]
MKRKSNQVLLTILLILFAFASAENASSQVVLGLNSGIYTRNLGDATYPGYGGHIGFQARIGKRMDIEYFVSFMRNVGRYENVPYATLRTYYSSVDLNDITYLNNFSMNATNFAFDGLFKVYRGNRLSIDLDLGLGLILFNERYAKIRPYSTDVKIESHRGLGFGVDMGLGCQYSLTDRYAVRLSSVVLSSTTEFNGKAIGMFGLFTSIILNLDNTSEYE